MGIQNGTATVEDTWVVSHNTWVVSHKATHSMTIISSNYVKYLPS